MAIGILELRSVRGTGGGPEKTILLGTEQCDRAKFAVTVCYIRDLRDQIFKLDQRAAPMAIDYVEVRERHSFDPAIWSQLAALVRARQIDIVHAHDYKTILLAFLLARRIGVIPMATAHGWTGQSRRERLLYYPLAKRLLARFPETVVVSSDLRADLIRHGGRPERIRVVLNAIDANTFRRDPTRRAAARERLGIAPGDFVVGSVGRLERQKRFDLLLEAVASVRSNPAVRLVVAGDGSLRTDLGRQAQALGISDRCLFLGHHEDIVGLHHALDLFVQSSEYEGTSNAVLEAMAMETPLVATDAGGTAELMAPGVHGLLVPRTSPAALAEAIQATVNDPGAARTRALAARRRVEAELSFEVRTRRLEAVYDDLIRARDQRRAFASPVHAPDA